MRSKLFVTTMMGFITCLTHVGLEANAPHLTLRSNESPYIQEQVDIQNLARQAKEEAEKLLVPEAVAVIDETKEALGFIKNDQNQKALATLEKAIGKINTLLARYPESALLAVCYKQKMIDTAPKDLQQISEAEKLVKRLISNKCYPASRILLNQLSSEIDTSLYCLALANYFESLQEAAKLLESKQPAQASILLENLLNTLSVMHQTFPIPLITATALLTSAEECLEKRNNKEEALKFVSSAKHELKRSLELGYLKRNEEYKLFSDEIEELERKIKKDQRSTTAFKSLRENIRTFMSVYSRPKSAFQFISE